MFRSNYQIIKKSGLFDEKYYLKIYEDIRKKDVDALKHYLKHGWKEGRNPSSNFETNFYLENYKDVKDANINPLIHYILKGQKEGRIINKQDYEYLKEYNCIKESGLFDEKYYIETYFDINGFDPITHYIKHGWKEGRKPSANFETSFYLENYKDVKDANINPLVHYILNGQEEDRVINKQEYEYLKEYNRVKESRLFDEKYYIETYPDINSSDPIEHYIKYGLKEGRFISKLDSDKYLEEYELINNNELFDKKYYVETYSDINGLDTVEHYVKYGWKEGRNPSANFETSFYLENNQDVKNVNINPLVHYILIGRTEGRFKNKKDFIKYTEEYELVNNSELFDKSYYAQTYIDIDDIDTVEHYLKHGWKEGRNPSRNFETSFYLRNYKDVKDANINPLVHFIKFGKIENRKIVDDIKDLSCIVNLLNNDIIIPKFKIDKPIDIIIPIYNGFEFLEPLIDSIVKNTSMNYRIIMCDDKSSDEKVLPLLKELKDKNLLVDMILLENEQNLGFIKTVNKLVKYTNNHFVLLNTDTELPPFWIERLMYPIFEMKNISSTTPFTNAGTICSFPNYLEDNLIYKNMNVKELDNYFQYVNFEKTYIEIPTGVGFCMGVNKDLVNRIGMFDEIFGKGYGEENDWCQRAIKEGYKNIHVPNLFVYHKHGGSFPSEEKQRLITNNLITLNQKHTTYDEQVRSLVQNNELENLRRFIKIKINNKKFYTTLIFDHSLGGGANHYIDEDIERRIKLSEIIILIRYDFIVKKSYIIEFITADEDYKYNSKNLNSIFELLSNLNINEIFLNSLVSYPTINDTIEKIVKFKEVVNAKMVLPIHDFFPLCPSYTLLNEKMSYCGIPENHTICNNCLKNNKNEFKIFEKEDNIFNWRIFWNKIISVSDKIICFSNSSKEIFLSAYPNNEEKISVIPHDISGRYTKIYIPNEKSERIIIGVLGGINLPKGANIIKDLVEYIDNNKLNAKIVLIGQIAIHINSSSFEATGRYNKEELPKIVKKHNITKFLIPSIWPETFSYTTDEIMQMGYPLIVFNLGAPAERVKNYELGKVVEINKINEVIFES